MCHEVVPVGLDVVLRRLVRGRVQRSGLLHLLDRLREPAHPHEAHAQVGQPLAERPRLLEQHRRAERHKGQLHVARAVVGDGLVRVGRVRVGFAVCIQPGEAQEQEEAAHIWRGPEARSWQRGALACTGRAAGSTDRQIGRQAARVIICPVHGGIKQPVAAAASIAAHAAGRLPFLGWRQQRATAKLPNSDFTENQHGVCANVQAIAWTV